MHADALLGKVFLLATTEPAPPWGVIKTHHLVTLTEVDPVAGTVRLFDHRSRASSTGPLADFAAGVDAGIIEEYPSVAPYAAWAGF